MKTERPVYLSLTQFAWPFTAIASITHRVTGVLLVLGVGFLLWLAAMALESSAGFAAAKASSVVVFLLTFIATAAAGAWLW